LLAKTIALKNKLLKEQNFNLVLLENKFLNKGNLPFSKFQFMSIIEQHLKGEPTSPLKKLKNGDTSLTRDDLANINDSMV